MAAHVTAKDARVVRAMAHEFAGFARANRRDAARMPTVEGWRVYKAAEAEMVRIALGYRFAARNRASFEHDGVRLTLR